MLRTTKFAQLIVRMPEINGEVSTCSPLLKKFLISHFAALHSIQTSYLLGHGFLALPCESKNKYYGQRNKQE